MRGIRLMYIHPLMPSVLASNRYKRGAYITQRSVVSACKRERRNMRDLLSSPFYAGLNRHTHPLIEHRQPREPI